MTTPTRSPLSLHNENVLHNESPRSNKLDPFPPPTPEDAAPPPPPPPPPSAPAVDDSSTVTSPTETLRSVALPIIFNEHPLSLPILACGNAAVSVAYLLDLNPLNAASWTLLACVMKGFARSIVSPPKAPPTPVTAEQLQQHVPAALAALNAARDVFVRVFHCTDPRLALRAAVCLYCATIVSARVSTHCLAWTGLNLAFVLPAALKAGVLPKAVRAIEEKIALLLARPKAQELLQKLQAHPHLKTASELAVAPKAQIAGGFLLWFFCLSWFNKMLSAGFVCLHLKAQGHITPATELQVGEAVDQIKKQAKKQARRMSMAGGAMLERVGMASPPKAKPE